MFKQQRSGCGKRFDRVGMPGLKLPAENMDGMASDKDWNAGLLVV